MTILYKRNEDKVLKAIQQYIDKTYSQHYSSASGRDVVDDWEDMGIAKEAYLSNMLKYVKRLGKKEGWNPLDVMKVIHYSVFLLNEMGKEQNASTRDSEPASYG